jgi:hypothetical protein
MSVKETLLNLGIQQLNYYYKYRNIIVKNMINELLEIANNIWYYLIKNKPKSINLALFINKNLTDNEIKSLFWIFKICNCGNNYFNKPKSLNSLELINFKLITNDESCQCNHACCYLHKSYNYNKYHIWI